MVSKLEEFKWQELTETCYNVTPKPQVTRKNSGDVSLHGNPAGRLRTQAKSTYRLLCVIHGKAVEYNRVSHKVKPMAG
jgi:hypothetical protein